MERREHIACIKATFEEFREAFEAFDRDGHSIQRNAWMAYSDLKDCLTAFEQAINRMEVVNGPEK